MYVNTHTHSVCSPAAVICWHEHTSARVLRGGWRVVGGRAGFLAGLRLFTPHTGLSVWASFLVSSRTPLSSVCHYRCLSLQIANRCLSQSWVSDMASRWGWWDYAACKRITSEMLADVCCCWCGRRHSNLLRLSVMSRAFHCFWVKSTLTAF